MLPNTSTAFLIQSPISDFDMFYSPHHSTFLMVYMTCNADNTFYWRYLQTDHAIPPPRAGDDPSVDHVENIVKYTWSEEQVLYKADTPPAGNYIYAGAVHAGYFGQEDVTNGGLKMLISWTQHTGQDANTPASGYAHLTAAVTMG